jgi:hypothetical protein
MREVCEGIVRTPAPNYSSVSSKQALSSPPSGSLHILPVNLRENVEMYIFPEVSRKKCGFVQISLYAFNFRKNLSTLAIKFAQKYVSRHRFMKTLPN